MKKYLILLPILLSLFSGFSQTSENVELIYLWNDTTIALNFRDSRYSDVWGFEQDSREYAVIGSTFGTHLFDVTSPTNTIEIDRKPGSDQGFNINHRDYKDYNGYLYGVCDEGLSSLQIFDLSNLPDSYTNVYDSNELFTTAHTIFIDKESEKLYACGTNVSGLSIYSLENPELPTLLIHYEDIGYVHDMYAKNNIAYLNAGDGMYVVDFSDTANPILLGSLTDYEDQGYNHSGWLHEDGETYVFCDETPGSRVKITDVSDLSDIQIVSTVSTEVSPNSIAHNAFIKGDIMYIAYYNDGMWMFNISDPELPYYLGHFDTFPFPQDDDNRGAWGVYPYLPSGNILVSDRNTGFHIFDVSEAEIALDIKDELVTTHELDVFPNPFSNKIKINNLPPSESFLVSILNMQGEIIHQSTIAQNGTNKYTEIQINELQFPPGLYTIMLTSNEFNISKKLIKK